MSFQAKLYVGESEFTVLTAEFSLNRPLDPQNLPNGHIRGGIIDITLESSREDHALISWIVSNGHRDGRLEFARRDAAGSAQKTVTFTHAYCVFMKQLFISDGSIPMILKISISSHIIDIDSNTVRNRWAGMESESGSGSESSGSSSSGGSGATFNTVTFDEGEGA